MGVSATECGLGLCPMQLPARGTGDDSSKKGRGGGQGEGERWGKTVRAGPHAHISAPLTPGQAKTHSPQSAPRAAADGPGRQGSGVASCSEADVTRQGCVPLHKSVENATSADSGREQRKTLTQNS